MAGEFRWIGERDSTLFDPNTGQNMHSEVGSTQEAELIFFRGSRIASKMVLPAAKQRIQNPQPFRLWDIGLGFGMNALQVWDFAHTVNPCEIRPLIIESFEPHLGGLRFALENREKGPLLFQKWSHHLSTLLEKGFLESGVHQWRLHPNDFYTTNLNQEEKANVIFYDLYCPKIDPLLWSRDRFKFLLHHCDGVLVTYSAATWVRTNLIFAGFHVGHGPGTPMKLESTCAWSSLEQARRDGAALLEDKWLAKVRRSSRAFSPEYAGIEFHEEYQKLLNQNQFRHLEFKKHQEINNL